MRFEETWFSLNNSGFQKFPYYYEDLDDDFPPKRIRSRRHQDSLSAKLGYERLFVKGIDYIYSIADEIEKKQVPPKRDTKLKINGDKKCVRCNSTKRLQRDHIKPLWQGGLDVTDNLQWLCYVCHKVKTAKDKILEELQKHTLAWKKEMLEYRLVALERLNPIGQVHFIKYWKDEKTHYQYWYYRNVLKPKHPISQQKLSEVLTMKIDQFVIT